MPSFQRVSIVGVGLLGGSIALALGERQPDCKVTGIGRRLSKLKPLVESGMLHEAVDTLADGVAAADLVIVCTPVEQVAPTLCEALDHAPSDCLATDVGSTKGQIVGQVMSSSDTAAQRFVGSHPLAGDHRSGAEFARADLLESRTVVVTPVESTEAEATKRIAEFWASLGANVVQQSPQQHDAALGFTSHLPHAVASALAASTPAEVLPLAASGWADTARVAAADPTLWRQIFLSNREAVLAAIDQFDQHLAWLRTAIAEGDEAKLEQLLSEGKRRRDALGN